MLIHRRTTHQVLLGCCRRRQSSTYSLQQEIEDANRRFHNRICIVSTSTGYGLQALQLFAPHQVVLTAQILETSSVPNSHTIQLDWDRHARLDLPGRFLNHACDANVGLTLHDNELVFAATRPITRHQAITWDYETFEWSMDTPFDCACGAKTCRGRISGFCDHADEVYQANDAKYVAPYLQERYEESKHG